MTTVPQTEVDRNVGAERIWNEWGGRTEENSQWCHPNWKHHVSMMYIIKKKLSRTDKKKCITLILTSMLLCETPDVFSSQTSRRFDCTGSLPWICVRDGEGRNPGPFVSSSGVSGVRLQIRWVDFSKASLYSAWQPSTCCALSLLKEESRTVSLWEACGEHKHLKQVSPQESNIWSVCFFPHLFLSFLFYHNVLQV